MIKKRWLSVLILAGVLALAVWGGVIIKIKLDQEELLKKIPDRGIPRMNISLNHTTLEEIAANPKESKYEGNNVEVYGTKGLEGEYIKVQLSGRGNSTWNQPKKPFQIKFNEKVDLFGTGKARKWVLLANYLDISLIRNDIAMMLAEMLEIKYNKRGRFAEIYMDGEYEGLYYIVNKIEISKESVNLRENGGVLAELDNLYAENESCHMSYLNDCLVLKQAVVNDGNNKLFMDDFLEVFNEFEIALERRDFAAVSEMIDVESFAKYYILSEITVNPDAYSSSFYLYKDGKNDKIHAGPAWDFDYALNNQNWISRTDEEFRSPYSVMVRKKEAFGTDGYLENKGISKIFYYLMDIPEFEEIVKKVFNEKMLNRADELTINIRRSFDGIKEAARSDNNKWGEGSLDEEVESLIKWLSERYDFLNKMFGECAGDCVGNLL